MNIQSSLPKIIAFDRLPVDKQAEFKVLIENTNRDYLHCEDKKLWKTIVPTIKYALAKKYFDKIQKKKDKLFPQINPDNIDQQIDQQLELSRIIHPLSQENFHVILSQFKHKMEKKYYDSEFTDHVVDSLKNNILYPLRSNADLANSIASWASFNLPYLPLGAHLVDSYIADMNQQSKFAQHILKRYKFDFIPEATTTETVTQVKKFLKEVMNAHSLTYGKVGVRTQKTAVSLSVKNGAGGHTAPSKAIETLLRRLGWNVVTLNYDTDFNQDNDLFKNLGITFKDGSPMTKELFATRIAMPKTDTNLTTIIEVYANFVSILHNDLNKNNEGGDLLRKQILPLNPNLIITTCAYHWAWESLAYRVPQSKVLVVASDVNLHFEALQTWYRQLSIKPELRQVHFGVMTDDLELLKCCGKYHDLHYTINPSRISSLTQTYDGLKLDNQITVIGAPVTAEFNVDISQDNIQKLRKKWGVPENAVSVCISRGKLGYTSDFKIALEAYRTTETLPQPVIMHVVCGENKEYYDILQKGINLGPNITVIPHPLLNHADFAEIRAFSLVDDIKAGGGSTFEHWYLASKGIESYLFLTPGPKLWWERCNILAMEKWGVGEEINPTTSKVDILKKLMTEGLPKIKNLFPDWEAAFNNWVKKYE